jgi:lipopolysaccharide biosynthesis regulator YciM
LEVTASKMAVMLGSAVFGALVVLMGVAVQSTGDFFRNWKKSRLRQTEEKVQNLFSKGLNSMLSRRDDLASTQFEKVLAIKPNHVGSLLRLGTIFRRAGDYPEAIKLHQRAMHADEKNIEAMFALVLDYELAGRSEDSLSMLDGILARDSENLRALAKIRDTHMRAGDFEKAEKTQERVLKLSLPAKERAIEEGRLVGLKYENARVHLEDGDLDGAKRTFKQTIKLDPKFVPAYLGLGEVYIEEDRDEDASRLWEDAYKSTGSVIFLHRLEDLYLRIGTPSRIIGIYKDALNAKPGDLVLNFFLGKLYHRLEMVNDAYETLSSVDATAKFMPDLHKLLGNLLYKRGNCDEAVGEFKKALSFREQLVMPYICDNCDHFSTDWSGRCPKCGRWNTFNIDLDKYC